MVDQVFINGCLLVLSAVMGGLLVSPINKQGNFYLRVRSWWWMLGVLALVTFAGQRYFQLLIWLLGAYGALEILSQHHPLSKWNAAIGVVLLPASAALWSVSPLVSLLVLSSLLFTLAVTTSLRHGNKKLSMTLLLCLFASIVAMSQLLAFDAQGDGISWVLYLFFVTQINDVSQYFWGKSCGKSKLLQNVSPNKTREGALGGVLTSSLLGVFVGGYLLDLEPMVALSVSMLLAITGICGDLLVSLYKRRVGVKDMGALIPGHGGLLDRIDSLLISAPVLWMFSYQLMEPALFAF
ncbi:phosphatidate cytidylyltransferase [Vibrio xiamenensis]|uniref:Phosphatidate cytidylyltransferase n=1 Tax=Vibrio xiamenensis TaxID=861298 RepID=A0A1G7XZ30_9VIBR|nr:phosphatidate cytidylyltransferase [Vibrio xiamenensis]SDG77878.1 phosphatidate cytidylyltransferase [Vibrio xiamenensis]SDG89353.1 phosphatidate cytidylyltransferase [Vibrio xiamenensis]